MSHILNSLYSTIQSITETTCQTSIAQSNSLCQADQRDTTNRSRIKDHQQICHQLAADTQMSTTAATMTAAVGQADHYTPSAEKGEVRKQEDSYLSSEIEFGEK